MKKLILICTIFLLFTSMNIWAKPYDIDNLLSTISSQDKAALFNGMQVSNLSSKKNQARLIYNPNLDIFFDLENFVKLRKPQMLYESLFFVEAKDIRKRKELMVFVANQLRDVQVLQTIKYKNLKDGNVHPLFDVSQVIKSPDGIVSAPSLPPLDINFTSKSDQSFVYQEMPPFDEVRSVYKYKYKDNYSEFLGRNITPIKYTGIKAIEENDMFTGCWIIETNQGILIYGVGSVKVTPFASIFNSVIVNSFSSRMVGLFTWLNNRIAEEKKS